MVELSIVLPTFNAGSFIENSLEELHGFLKRHNSAFEIVVVDDGSTDGSAKRIQSQNLPELRYIRLERNYGKGFAVACGMKVAEGRCRIFTDADLPYDLAAIPHSVRLINTRGYSIVVGDRTLPGSNYFEDTSRFRAAASKLFATIVRLGITGGMFDTQCGFKAFEGQIAEELFRMITLKGFGFDAELLYIALKYNMEIRRIPVRYRASSKTTVRPFIDGLRMLMSLFLPPRNWRLGKYKNENLEKLCRSHYWHNSSPGDL